MAILARWIGPVLTFIVIGAISFFLVLDAIPGRIMSRAMDRLLSFGGAANTAIHPPPVDETSRRVVRPSPDILYSICVYDLDAGPLRIETPWPSDGSYASVSFFDDATNNYAVLSDRDAEGDSSSIILYPVAPSRFSDDFPPEFLSRPAVEADVRLPAASERGVILYRRVISATDTAAADDERQAFSCAPMDG